MSAFGRDHGPAARGHFRSALSSARESAYVWDLWLAALLSRATRDRSVEVLRVADEMRRAGLELDASLRRRITSFAYFGLGRVNDDLLIEAMPPVEHLATLRWLAREREIAASADLSYWLARLTEAAGDPAAAITLFEPLLSRNTIYVERARQGIARCQQQLAAATSDGKR